MQRSHTSRRAKGQGVHMCVECGERATIKKPNGTHERICNHCKARAAVGAPPIKKPKPVNPSEK